MLGPQTHLEEVLFTGLRLVEGLDLEAVSQRFGADVWRRWGDDLGPFLEVGAAERLGSRLRLTRSGMLLANEVMSVFV